MADADPVVAQNSAWQTRRIKETPASLIARIACVVSEYHKETRLDLKQVVRDLMIDTHHLADVFGLDYVGMDRDAHQHYLEEIKFSQNPLADEKKTLS